MNRPKMLAFAKDLDEKTTQNCSMLKIAILTFAAIALMGCDHTRYNVEVWDITIDAPMNDTYVADLLYVDPEHITLALHDGQQIPLKWDDCPQYDSSGRLTGKRLSHYDCAGVNGPTAHDQRGHEWYIGGVHGS
jgi:hypothetical protein